MGESFPSSGTKHPEADERVSIAGHSLTDVIRNRRRNPHAKWEPPDDPTSAAHRLATGEFVRVHTSPSFEIQPGAKVVTIGSCFARNVERTLGALGMDVPANRFSLPDEYYQQEGPAPNAVLNKYSTQSIENEILLDLDLVEYPNNGFIEAPDGNWWDPLTTSVKALPFEQMSEVRGWIRDLTRNVLDCDVLLMTLGLNQVWLDRETGISVNEMPPAAIARAYPDRWELAVTGAAENVASLERVVTALEAANPEIRIVITVSPVPMSATFTTSDVIAANGYSKAVLRVAAQEIAERFDCVDYFPSYEMAVNSPPEMVWTTDRLHVTDKAVRFIVGCFVEDYVATDAPAELSDLAI